MLFTGLIQRRLVALLRPWLMDEPELEVKLGLLRSHGIARNLSLNTSALNQLLEDPSRMCFKEVIIEQFDVHVANWSAPAFTFQIHGLHITLSLCEKEEGGVERRLKPRDTSIEQKTKLLAELDPQGSSLHAAMERIAEITAPRWTTSLFDHIFQHCRLNVHDVHVILQPSHPNNNLFSFSFRIKELGVGCQSVQCCFLNGVISSFIFPSRESYFDLEIKSFEIRLKTEDRMSNIVPSTNLHASIKVKNLLFLDFDFSVEAVKFSLSPFHVSTILLLFVLLSKEVKCVRNGRQLWNIAADKIRSLTSMHKFLLHKFVWIICNWIRYIHTYENMLLLVGYLSDDAIRRSVVFMIGDKAHSRAVKQQWKTICQIEEELPSEAIALARRIIRNRAALGAQRVKEYCHQSKLKTLSLKICRPLHFVWKYICSLFHSIKSLLFFRNIASKHSNSNTNLGHVPDCSLLCRYIGLDVGEFSISISPETEVHPSVSGNLLSDIGLSYHELLSFSLSIDVFCLRYSQNITQQCFAFGCESLKVVPLSLMEDSSRNSTKHLKGSQKKKVHNLSPILWVEPAEIIHSVENAGYHANDTGVHSFSLLDFIIGEMLLKWRKCCPKNGANEIQDSKNPFLLCEIKSFLTDETQKNLISGSLSCGMVVGRLNLVIEHASIASVAVISSQIKNALSWTGCNMRTDTVLHAPTSLGDPPCIDWSSKYISLSTGMAVAAQRLLPQKHIQMGIRVAGPHIQISLGKLGLHGQITDQYHAVRNNMVHLRIEAADIELAVSPNLETDFTFPSGSITVSDAKAKSLALMELHQVDIPKSNDETISPQGCISFDAYLKFNGLKVYLDVTDNPRCQIIVLTPVTFRLLASRKDLHSLGSTVVAWFISLSWMVSGLAVLLFLDELDAFVKVAYGLFCAVLHVFNLPSLGIGLSYQEFSRQEMSPNLGNYEVLMTRMTQGGPVFMRSLIIQNMCELKSVEIILHYSRKGHSTESDRMNAYTVINKKLDSEALLDYGIHIYVKQSDIMFSFVTEKMELSINLSGFQSDILGQTKEIAEFSDQLEIKNLIQSLHCLYGASFSHCTFSLCLKAIPRPSLRNAADLSTSGSETSQMSEDSPLIANTDDCLHMTIVLDEVYLAGCPVKDLLGQWHKSNKLEGSLSVGGKLQRISCQTQGGYIIIETTALMMFIQCFTLYHCQFRDLWPAATSSREQHDGNTDAMINLPNQELQCQQLVNWNQLEALSINISQLSLALMGRDESGRLQELLLEATSHFNLETPTKISFSISKLSILSCSFDVSMKKKIRDTNILSLSSVTSNDPSSIFIHGDTSVSSNYVNKIHSLDDASSSSSHVLQKEYLVDESGKSCMNNIGSQNLLASPQNYVLRNLTASIVVERLAMRNWISSQQMDYFWVGNGSLSGFDMTLSLPEIQMILFAGESISGLSSNDTSKGVEQRHWSSSQESAGSMNHSVPDGAIVAIEDVCQHMFIAVDRAESGYTLVGEIHYSLAGERALFRVKYHDSRRWRSQIPYFSLISLYAKDETGESLRLSCRPRSDFVDISSSDHGACTLWSAIPCKSKAFDRDAEYDPPTKHTFQLVNKKNDLAAAFVNGVLEFVIKPGNPFKWKVFHNHFPAVNNLLPSSCLVEESQTGSQRDLHLVDGADLRKNGNTLGITITMDNISWTIVHELSDTKEKFPLLQGSIGATEIVVQLSNIKIRVISRLQALLYFFDAKKNLWRELMQPLEVFLFYRYRLLSEDLEHVSHQVPGHFYARIGELNLSMSELSLDIVLFVIGQLNLAGPYAVRSSSILANCCKIENKSSLTLVCNFYDNQDVSVAGRQSNIIFLRHLALTNQPSDASFFSIQLTEKRALSTSLIHLSLLEAQAFACRTRIESLQESKISPGPFLVVEISPMTEDGFSVVVAPLLQVHNETDFPMELRFQRGQQKETEYASVVLKAGDTIDDSMATFGAINLSGEQRKALMSVSVGNFLLSFRPSIIDEITNSKILLVHWSSDLKGRKPVHLSGLFDKLTYQVRKAFSVDSLKHSFDTAYCDIKLEDGRTAKIHFLIHSIGKDVPLAHPDTFGYVHVDKSSSISLQEQKEIFLLPTVCVSNLLHTEIHVTLNETDPHSTVGSDCIWNKAIIPSGSCVKLYADPMFKYFNVTLTAFGSSCKPVDSTDWAKRLQKQKSSVQHLDIELDFCSGKYFALLRLSRGHRGILEAAIFTSYTLENDTAFPLFCFPANQKPMSRDVVQKLGYEVSPELGSYLPPKSTRSWFMKCHKVRLTLTDENASHGLLDLDALSGLTEVDIELEGKSGFKDITKLGVSLRPYISQEVPAQMISMNPRYVVVNESKEVIYVRQCYLEEDGTETIITVNSKERIALTLRKGMQKKRETTVFENFLKKHQKSQDLLFIQFRLNESGLSWSGPVCIASLGRFFLKFRRSSEFPTSQSDHATYDNSNKHEFASVYVVEEGSSLVLHFHQPPNIDLPYRIENCLHDTAVTYYQKDSLEPAVLGSGSSINYVWDDLTLPHKLIVQIGDVHLLREISLDKVREWKQFYRIKQQRGLGFHLPIENQPENLKSSYGKSSGTEMVKLGYEVYTDGLTRVLRISQFADRRKGDTSFHSKTKMQLIISSLAIQLLECAKQEISEVDMGEPSIYTPILVARLENISLYSVFTDKHKLNQLSIQALSVDQKWPGAPFAAMLRRNQLEDCNKSDSVLRMELVLVSSSSKVKQVKYLSIVLQPLDFKLDEETLMKIVPFWRSSLSDSNAPSQQYYFDHFEIHPIKIVASFLPGEAYASYSSTQETLRTLIHSVIKMPVVKNMTVELNGVLVTHVLLTLRELSIKCAQHYSWYAMRAIYIAKGSPLLPPAFASIFDDFASSSLDVFFDPSSGFINFPGLTIGTFKLIRKCTDGKGFSGTKRYFGDLGKTLKSAGSNILFAAVTEISDSVLKGAEASGFNGMVSGFHQGILKLAMEPSVLGTAFMEGGPDRKIKLDRSPGVDELYIEGYLQAMLDTIYKQEYLRVRVIENQVILKNLPPNSSLIDEIVERVKGFLVSKALLKGDSSKASHPLRHIRGESEWRIGPTVLTLCEHLFVSFAIRMLRKQANKVMANVKWKGKPETEDKTAIVTASGSKESKGKFIWRWGIGNFVISGIVAYIDGRLCRRIPNPIARRIVSGFLLSFLDKNEKE